MPEKPTYEELEQRVRLLEDAESKIVLAEKELAESREKVRNLVELNTNLEHQNEKNKEIEKLHRLMFLGLLTRKKS